MRLLCEKLHNCENCNNYITLNTVECVNKKVIAAIVGACLSTAFVQAPAMAMVNGTEVSVPDDQAWAVVQIDACTGTIIDPHWVLTAKHCVEAKDIERTAYHGLNRPFDKDPQAKKYKVTAAYWAPYGDVALAYVPERMHLDKYPEIGETDVDFGTRGRVFGWGFGTGDRLKKADVAVAKYVQDPYYDLSMSVQYLGEAYPARGDSGGPLFVDNTVVGVLSRNGAHGPLRYFGSVTRVSDWIKQKIATTSNEEPRPNLENDSEGGLDKGLDKQALSSDRT
ncbi:S1 family peptidase [Corynebacterium ulcerans]|nr:hypothetical protein CULC0211_19620 [Corynebacterium ulcerans]BBJ75132.1 hypothetical protein CULCFH20161_19590 [Corynebacterium ulcerans]